MILHMRHTLWTGISETNVNFITSATRIHAFNKNKLDKYKVKKDILGSLESVALKVY